MKSELYLTERHLRLPDGSFPHFGVKEGGVAPYVLLAGAPERVKLISKSLDNVRAVAEKRGYLVYNGNFQGVAVSVASSGLGGPSCAIAIEELGAAGGGTFIRVGSCASIREEAPVGSVIIATACVRDDRTGDYFAPVNYPAVADFRTVAALCRAAESRNVPYNIGVIRSTDSFYEGERKKEIIEYWCKKHVWAFEMESGTSFTVAGTLGYRAATILVPGSNLVTGQCTYQGRDLEAYNKGIEHVISVALEAVVDLAAKEKV